MPCDAELLALVSLTVRGGGHVLSQTPQFGSVVPLLQSVGSLLLSRRSAFLCQQLLLLGQVLHAPLPLQQRHVPLLLRGHHHSARV